MSNIKIISHRGARGLETENTLESLKAAVKAGADRVEFDVWTTQDNVPILNHDADFRAVAGDPRRVFKLRYEEIQKLRTHDGKKIISADMALAYLKRQKVPAYIEIKDFYLSSGVLKLLEKYRGCDTWVGSNNHSVMTALAKKRPDLYLVPGTIWHPVETMHFARKHKIQGMSLSFHWFNPVVYFFCRRYGIELLLYTINSPWQIKFIKKVYPGVSIITDYPDRAVKLIR